MKEAENRVKETAGKSKEFGITENKEEENFKEGVENNVNATDKTSSKKKKNRKVTIRLGSLLIFVDLDLAVLQSTAAQSPDRIWEVDGK